MPREAQLADQFAVSRQAVREALKVLAAKGLVQSRRRSGTTVLPRKAWNLLDPDVLAWHLPARLPPRLLTDLIELRRLIEPAAAEYAARRGDEASIAAIGAALEAMRAAVGDAEMFRRADADFHVAVFAASGNELIDRLSDILGPLLRASFFMQDVARGMTIAEDVIPAHQGIFDAIVARDHDKARREMELLISDASREVQAIAARIADPP